MSSTDNYFQRYVLVFPRHPQMPTKVGLVLKDKPAWQKGRFNLIGGKVEEGEAYDEAAARELWEESGLGIMSNFEALGSLEGEHYAIVVYSVYVHEATLTISPGEGETELVAWYDWPAVRDDPRLIENLRVIIPLCQAGVKGWAIRDLNGNDRQPGPYKIEVAL